MSWWESTLVVIASFVGGIYCLSWLSRDKSYRDVRFCAKCGVTYKANRERLWTIVNPRLMPKETKGEWILNCEDCQKEINLCKDKLDEAVDVAKSCPDAVIKLGKTKKCKEEK